MDKLIPSYVLDNNPECGTHLQNMMVEVHKSSTQHATLIPEEPLQGLMEEHIRYNTRKRRVRYGPHSTWPIALDLTKSRKRNSDEISQTFFNKSATMMEHASPPKKSKSKAVTVIQPCLNK